MKVSEKNLVGLVGEMMGDDERLMVAAMSGCGGAEGELKDNPESESLGGGTLGDQGIQLSGDPEECL